MNCEQTIIRFLENEDYARLPLLVHLHLIFCPECRAEIERLQKSFVMVSETGAPDMPRNLVLPIMKSIEEFESVYKPNVSNIKWIAAGVVLFASILCIPFNNNLVWLNEYFGGNLEIPMALVLGTAMSIYAAVFAGSHLSFVNKDRIIKFISRFIDV